jgi:hypothetical protein
MNIISAKGEPMKRKRRFSHFLSIVFAQCRQFFPTKNMPTSCLMPRKFDFGASGFAMKPRAQCNGASSQACLNQAWRDNLPRNIRYPKINIKYGLMSN